MAIMLAGTGSVVAPPQAAMASWTGTEYGTDTFRAGTVNPPINLRCTAGLLSPPTFTWDLPVGGLTRSAFTWSLSGAFSGGGTLAANATTVTIPGPLLAIGTGTLHLSATGPGGWTSSQVTGSVGMLTAVLYFCSVP
ncbi:hypothetical protein [Micromonospora sp. HUAS LYJ1]|uniref:hypothetical protein n=1 Tax=Micromonospora sp. HUAS LYJ1 TaxID=3061626 RepID=UPI00267227FF|nr:hypothetical protein [Micromonospora sp. HUAS LYJ1]WKU03377.1 hypothetical protein Q2K16_21320 [Micromonospora sp. HUAS LYJ1]